MTRYFVSDLVVLAQAVTEIDPQAIFGGAVLLFVLTMLVVGKLRLDREVHSKDEVVKIYEKTIEDQRQTIRQITTRDEATHRLLQELRDLAMKDDFKRSVRRERGEV